MGGTCMMRVASSSILAFFFWLVPNSPQTCRGGGVEEYVKEVELAVPEVEAEVEAEVEVEVEAEAGEVVWSWWCRRRWV